jgi:hypothetical protein
MLKEKPVTRLDHEPPSPTWGQRKQPMSAPTGGSSQRNQQ